MKKNSGVEFEADGKRYMFSFTFNALAEIEIATGKSTFDIGDALEDPKRFRMSELRAVFHGGLQEYQADLTPADAGRVVAAIGIPKAVSLIAEALKVTADAV